MPETNLLKLDSFLCFAVYSANLAFARVYRPLLDPLGLTYVQYIVLVALWERDNVLVGELGDRLYLASNTLTPVLKRLEALGHITRSRDSRDERQVLVRLTKTGRALQARAGGVPECMLDASGLQLTDLRRMQQGITALRDRLFDNALSSAPPSRPHRAAGRTTRKASRRERGATTSPVKAKARRAP